MARTTVTRSTTPANYAIGSNSGKGILADDPSRYPASPDGSHDFSTAGTASLVSTTGPDGETKVVQVEYNSGATSYGQLRNRVVAQQLPLGNNNTPGVLNSFGVWVKNPGAHTLDFSVLFFNASAVAKGQINMAAPADNQWHFLVATFPKWSVSFTASDTSSYIRFQVNSPGAPDATWIAGDLLQFGKCYFNPRSRAKFIISTDDGFTANVASPAGYPTGYGTRADGSGTLDGNYLDCMNHYGFVGTANIISGIVGTTNYMTWAQIAQLAAAGWSLCNHGMLNYVGSGNQGVTYLTPAALTADIIASKALLDAQGYTSQSDVFALPQGAWTDAHLDAILAGGTSVIVGISTYDASMGIPVGDHAQGGATNGTNCTTFTDGRIDITSRVQIDGTPTLANIQSYINNVIRCGGTGGCFTHDISAATAAKFDGMCYYLKQKQQLGLIDVVTMAQWRAGL